MANRRHSAAPPARDTYRHGDLRRALLDAAIAMAREGGPSAVVLREATRRAGVVPNAAYRHYAGQQDLLQAVRAAALAALARRMEKELSRIPPGGAAATARASLRAVGSGYLAFAQEEPGLFRTAFRVAAERGGAARAATPDKAGASGLNPYGLLGLALDRMVAADILAADRRKDAEYLAWSAVHGLADLVIDGPLARLSAARRATLARRLLEMVESGLA